MRSRVESAAVEPPDNLRVVVVGGRDPDAVGRFVANVPDRSQLAIVVVGCELDAAALRTTTHLPVTAVDSRARLVPDHVFVIPERRQAAIDAGEVVLDPDLWGTAPIDATMRSAADAIGRSAVGVVLYGKGTEGALGIKRIKEVGGLTIAQRPDDGELAEMAKHAIATGLVDLVLPIEDIPTQVLALLPGLDALDELDKRRGDNDAVRDILTLVRLRTDHDFTAYKRATLLRRIARRTQVCGCDTIVAYHTYLREHPQELANLLRDFLISVTSFFRDARSYDALAREALPRMFANRTADDTIRVWVAGCATGEEAYSIAILMLEHARALPSPPHVQVFATDIDENALAEARLGWYPETIAVDVSADRLERYFTRGRSDSGGRYQVRKEVRELVLFSPHNLLRDPPFSRLDLVTCRNLLIYLDRSAQDHVLTMFHFGLRTDGMLFLGSSESVESTRLFTTLDPKHRLFARRTTPTSISDALSASASVYRSGLGRAAVAAASDRSSLGELHHQLVEQYAPPSVLVDANLEIVHLSEHAGRFLQHAGGVPTRELMKLVIAPLQLDLRGAIYRARQAGIDRRVVRFDQEDRTRVIEIRVRHIDSAELGAGALLVFFDELAPGDDAVAQVIEPTAAIEPVVREIEGELQRTRDRLRSTIEQYETSLEELKASNEELQAINEELRSTTEELETNKEELQSVNEELMTLNRELAVKVDEVSTANSDLQNLMTSTQIGVVFLDRDLCIKRFTPRVQDLFNLIASDLGRPLSHLTHKLEGADLSAVAQTVLDSLRGVERELHTRDGRRYLVRWLPYRSIDDRIDGVVVTFVDVTDLRDAIDARRRSEAALHLVEERLRAALRVAPIAIISFDAGMRALWAYANGRELAEPEHFAPMFAPGEANRLVEIARQVVEQDVGQRAELELELDGRTRTYDFRVEPTADGASAVGFDITPSKLAEVSLLEADRRKDAFLATLSNELRSPIAPLKVAIDVARLVDDDPAKRAHSLSIMERQVAMLSELVDELVDLSLVTHGKVELTLAPVDITHAVEAAVEASARLFAAHGVDVRMHHPGQPVLVDGDQRRLVQVVANLLTNAAHHTPSGGHVDIDVAADRDHRRVSVRVTDDGAGIAPEQLPHMFDIFVQSRDARGRSQGGLGIGLSVVRRLVELHGGEVDAFSDGVGTGSTFIVHLPIRKE